jgi:hypothetical protein
VVMMHNGVGMSAGGRVQMLTRYVP